jgi:PAS domain S-box-containing protein
MTPGPSLDPYDEVVARLAAIVESSEDAIIAKDLDGVVTSWNAAAERMYGYSAAEIIGATMARLVPSDRMDEEREIMARIKGGETVGHLETVRLAKDGRRIDVSVTISPIKDATGKVVGASKIARDMTERLRTRETLKQREKQYRVLFQTHPIPAWLYDVETLQFLTVNDAAVEHYGYSREEFLVMTIKDIRPPEDVPALLGSPLGTSEEPREMGVWRHLTKSGEIILADIYATAIRFEDRAAQLIIAIDVTKQRRAAEKIRESECRLRALVSSMEDIALEFDLEGTYVAIWTTNDDLLSHPRSELIGRKMSDLHAEAIARPFLEAIRRVSRSRVTENISYSMDVMEGHRDFHARISPIIHADGTCDRVCILARDMTEQKKLEAQFLRAQRVESIGTLASGVAHDLNNILSPILMGAAVLRRSELGSSDEKILSTIELCAHRGADIVRQVLTFARGAEGDRLNLPAAPLIRDVATIAQETFPKKIAVRTRIAESIWPVVGDPTQLHQVLINLSVNARDAMPGGGTLTLGVENFAVDEHYASMMPGARPGPYVRLDVIDTGMGIPSQNLDKIFDPFFTTKELGHGTGLGLSTVIGIVKSHGGFMSVYSEVGRGSTFRVYLPAKIDEPETLNESPDAVFPLAEGELLLLVDDEKPILQIAQALLQGHGYQVLTAADAAEALALFAVRKDDIQVVLTDLSMPVMDGIALIRTLQKMKPDVRVIASTGRGGQEQHSQELEELNVHSCLTKPYNKTKLLKTLHDALHAT